MDLMNLIKFIGGLALFIYGMTSMGSGLEKVAGAKLEKTLEKVTGNFIKAFFMGIAVTALIQSSSATTVMVVGFVNAGIMTLKQSVGVILGANIGTTITAQILRLDSGTSLNQSFFMQLLKPSNLAYLIVFIAILFLMLGKTKKQKYIAEILFGFGILFIGMNTMETAVSPLKDIEAFQNLFVTFSNPILGVLVGATATALIQSSSASVGILQALSTTGVITYASAIPIILGQNIGTCITALISSVGANKNAKRASMIHFYFNLLGASICLVIMVFVQKLGNFAFWDVAVDKVSIANFHSLFNVVSTLMFLPFTSVLLKLAQMSVKENHTSSDDFSILDTRFYITPNLALMQGNKCVYLMADKAMENFALANQPLFYNTDANEREFLKNEEFLDKAEVNILSYVLGINHGFTDENKKIYNQILNTLSEFEKLGDYSKNIFDITTTKSYVFSDSAKEQLTAIKNATDEILRLTCLAYKEENRYISLQIAPLEQYIDDLNSQLKAQHMDRLTAGECNVESSILFLDLIHYYEKIGDHCYNIATYISDEFDIHNDHSDDINFSGLYSEYKERFSL